MQNNNLFTKKGFTLIEVLVSVAVFSIVMLIATSAVFTIVGANKKSHAIKSVMTNLNFALESMMREIRMGSDYKCLGDSENELPDCPPEGVTAFRFKDESNTDVVYSLSGSSIQKVRDGDTQLITSAEVKLDEVQGLKFYMIEDSSNGQPRVLITISGEAGNGGSISAFNIQTTVTKRTI